MGDRGEGTWKSMRGVRKECLRDADVVCLTLGVSCLEGHILLKSMKQTCQMSEGQLPPRLVYEYFRVNQSQVGHT